MTCGSNMAEIKKGEKDGVVYLWANNLAISNPNVNTKEFTILYLRPSLKLKNENILELKDDDLDIITVKPKKSEDIEALHKLWWALKEIMKKSHPGNDLNPYKIYNISYRDKITFSLKPSSQQMSLDLKTSSNRVTAYILDEISNRFETLGRYKEAYLYDVIANTLDTPGWEGNESNLFWDEMGNKEIDTDKVKKVLDLVKKDITDKSDLADKSDLEIEDVKSILNMAKKFKLF
jgi:hypothetical protein